MSYMPPDSSLAFAATRAASDDVKLRIAQFAVQTCEPLATPLDLDPDYLIKGLLGGAGTVSILRAPSNAGKSAVAVALAVHVAVSEPLAGLRVSGGGVLYIAAEAPRSVCLRIEPYRDRLQGRARVHLLARPLDLRAPVDRAALVSHAKRLPGAPVRLVVIDTLICCLGDGDENASRDMHAVIEGARVVADGLGAHVMLVHHTGHQQDRLRGSSALVAAIDSELALGKADDETRVVPLTTPKQRDMMRGLRLGVRLEPRTLGVDRDGDPITTIMARFERVTESEREAVRPDNRSFPRRSRPATDWGAVAREVLVTARGRMTAAEVAAAIPSGHPVWRAYKQDTITKRIREALRCLVLDASSHVVAEGDRFCLDRNVDTAALPAAPRPGRPAGQALSCPQ